MSAARVGEVLRGQFGRDYPAAAATAARPRAADWELAELRAACWQAVQALAQLERCLSSLPAGRRSLQLIDQGTGQVVDQPIAQLGEVIGELGSEAERQLRRRRQEGY